MELCMLIGKTVVSGQRSGVSRLRELLLGLGTTDTKSGTPGPKTRHADLQKGMSGACNRQRTTEAPGFTLLELMFVLALILILASISVPIYNVAIKRAREATLRQDLSTLRRLIDEYTVDKQHAPPSLQDLVEAGYLRGELPVDPMTGSSETWQVVVEDVALTPDQAQPGVVDVHSGSEDTSLEGTPYSSW